MELKISDARILAAARTCPQARQVLEVLFPEVFKPEDRWVVVGTIVCWKGLKTERYIVAQTGLQQAYLISLTNGNRWSDTSLPMDEFDVYNARRRACIPREFTVEI